MDAQREMSIGQRLRRERVLLNWPQEKLAEKLGVSVLSISRWETDKVLPHPYYREQLCRLFKKSAEELGFISSPEGTIVSSESHARVMAVWKMPYLRNLYFTGREDTLKHLRNTRTARKTGIALQICAITGLGGIGKTQVAMEYVYRYAHDYEAILWARADSYQSLANDYVTFAGAELLDLPEKADTEQTRVVEAVKRWLQQYKVWLLILDNADDIETVYDFIPTRGEGHLVLTTRSLATGPGIKSFEIEKMGKEEGALLLLRRARIIAAGAPLESAAESERTAAEAICDMLDGLPLALDQAAAYITNLGQSILM